MWSIVVGQLANVPETLRGMFFFLDSDDVACEIVKDPRVLSRLEAFPELVLSSPTSGG